MLNEATRAATLAYYARIGAALFPLPAGSKNPTGIVESFKKDWSKDPAQWKAWYEAHRCNFGVVAFASRLIIVDIDTAGDRNEAWSLWCALCAEWQIPVAMPHVQSARGGWHVLFSIPADIDPSTLRQPDAVKKRINIRCIGFVVAAGSYYDGTAKGEQSGPYTLLSDTAPYPVPAALLEHCKRKPIERPLGASMPGSRNKDDVAALYGWLTERDQFTAYEDWIAAGMAAKLEYGDDGFALWELTFNETVSPDTALKHWESFASDADGHSLTLNTFLDRAHKLGWTGSVRKTAESMFSGLPAIVAAASGPVVSMMGGEEEFTRIGSIALGDFMADTAGAAIHPEKSDYPTLPEAAAGRGLYADMQAALVRLFVMAEQKPKFDINRANHVLGVLQELHGDVFNDVMRRLETMGHKPSRRKIGHVSQNIQEQVQRGTTGFDKWIRDDKSQKIENDNPDNVRFGLEYLGLELRWNAWLERMQIKGGSEKECAWSDWTNVDDATVAALLTRWARTRTRFIPGLDFAWRTLLAVARENTQDPVLDVLRQLEKAWDGTPRLSGWLTRYCGTPNDVYHQAVGKLIIGGMVMRARQPGCKFDFMPIFYGRQGTGKSTLAAMLALRLDWFSDTVMLGDASKELILALAGKLVVEISEMGMRGHANVNHVKAMISRQIDSGRTAYARSVSERPRRNIFIGTTNEDTPLSDPTGNRRFLPVRINTAIDLIGLFADIGQLIGEAAVLEARGEKFGLPADVWDAAAIYQEGARAASDLEILFCDWFAPTEHAESAFVTIPDIVKLYSATGRKGSGAIVHPIMERLGFREASPYIDGKKTRVWVRGPQMLPKHIPTLPRYIIDLTKAGVPHVVLRGSGIAPGGPMPPMPEARIVFN